MDQGDYKHFSHSHNLIMHQMPQGVEVLCSGCNSSCVGTVFVCWQCKFFLHEQCYRATRSLKHPSHPQHPLSLIPYPTYPSNSFCCNSCQIVGTGFSYSCSDCEFDLHVHCAYSLSRATSFQKTHPFQELVPQTWINGQNSNMVYNVADHSLPIPFTAPQNPYMPPSSLPDHQYHPAGHDQYHNLIASAQYPTGHSVSNPPNPTLHTQDSVSHLGPSVSIPNISQNSISNVQYSTIQPAPIARPQDPLMTQNGLKDKGIRHFSHPHILSVVDLQENEISCSACKDTLVGKGYLCVEPKCDFHLHESCFNLKKEIRHKSHPEHPLTLLPLAPYNNKNGEFTCNACFSDGTGYTYHCSICTFDLHIQCVNLPEKMKRNDHEHELKLFYSCPIKGESDKFTCDVCHVEVPKERWVYYCEPCDYGTHLGCIDREECEGDSVTDAQAQLQSFMDEQVQIQRLQLQMQMILQQHAQVNASIASAASGVKF